MPGLQRLGGKQLRTMQSDDFDLDALLQAQSSDEDDGDLPDLERSLDEILNDADPGDDATLYLSKREAYQNGTHGSHSEGFLVELDNEHLRKDSEAEPSELDANVQSTHTRSGDLAFVESSGIVTAPGTLAHDDGFRSEGMDVLLPSGDDEISSPRRVEHSTAGSFAAGGNFELGSKHDVPGGGVVQDRVSGQSETILEFVSDSRSDRVRDRVSNVIRRASSSEAPVSFLSSTLGGPIGSRVNPRPGSALAWAAAASRQVARTTSASMHRSLVPDFSSLEQHAEHSRCVFDGSEVPKSPARLTDGPASSNDDNVVSTHVRKIESTAGGDQPIGEVEFNFSDVGLGPEKSGSDTPHVDGSDQLGSIVVFNEWKKHEATQSPEVEYNADVSGAGSEFRLRAIPSFSDALPREQSSRDATLQEEEEMKSLLKSCEEVPDYGEEESSVHQLENLIGDEDDSDDLNAQVASISHEHFDAGAGLNMSSSDEENQKVADRSDSDDEVAEPELGLISTIAQNPSMNGKNETVEALENPESIYSEILESKEETEHGHVLHPTALELAEELEKRTASYGLHWEEGAAAQPMRLEGIQRGPPAIGLLQLDSAGTLSHALASTAMRRDHGSPQALAVHANFIAVGLSKGGVLVTPSRYSATRSADDMDAKKAFLLGGGTDRVPAAVSSICFNQQGDLLLVGYANGTLCLWDVTRGSIAKSVVGEHNVAIVHTLFLGQDAPAARHIRAISGDCKGLVLLHTFSQQLVPLLRRFSVTTQCLLDGQRTGTVLSVSPLLPDEGFQIMGGVNPTQQGSGTPPPTLGSVMGGVVGGVVGGVGAMDVGRKFLYDGSNSSDDGAGGMVVFVTHQTVLVVRLVPALEVCSRLPRPAGIREGAIPYTAWRRIRAKEGSLASSNGNSDLHPVSNGKVPNGGADGGHLKDEERDNVKDGMDDGDLPVLAMAWDKKMLIAQLTKTELRKVGEWELDSPAVGVAWLEEQMLVVVTAKDELLLFTKEGVELDRASLRREQEGMGALIYHTHLVNSFGNPEKAYHSSLSVRGAALYLLGPLQLWRARLLPWRDRIKALQDAGDWMGAFHIAMELYDGRARGVTGLPRGLDSMREAVMSTLLALLSAYIDEAFAYLSLAFGTASMTTLDGTASKPNGHSTVLEGAFANVESWEGGETGEENQEVREQYARVGGVAIEFCVHIGKREVLFEHVFSKFEAVGQRGTFLELLEPYILKDMLGGLAPEVMQALVEHYSRHGWLERVEQCVLHMDIGSLDFNQVVKLCREHGLYSALIYLFNKGLDDFRSPLEELLTVAEHAHDPSQAQSVGYKLLVYLKYCFSGFAFPPGHGSLPAKRLPTLRGEILQFLLDQQGSAKGQSTANASGVDTWVYPRLWHMLHLDVQATLMVLGLAFPHHGPLGIGQQSCAYQTSVNNEHTSEIMDIAISEDVDDGVKYVQAVVNALIEILDAAQKIFMNTRGVDEDSQSTWPSDEDVGAVLNFVAYFVALQHAVVPSSTFTSILEFLASPSPGSKKPMEREDLMVALLKAVPDSDLDAPRVHHLAHQSEFWQVTALLYARAGDHTAALDNYLKDMNRPQQPFTFVMQMLDHVNGLKGSVLTRFREAVLSRLPELMQHNINGTLWIVLEHLSNDNQQVIRELSSHPRLLFAYLKAIVNARSGSLPPPSVGSQQLVVSSSHLGSPRRKMGKTIRVKGFLQWEPDVNLAELLRRSGLQFTDEMAELYVQLLCQFEPRSVLKFLESHENYRLEHCLKLCQEYGITDAAIFLLERVGDVASALSLVLTDVDIHIRAMERSLLLFPTPEAEASGKGSRLLMEFTEVGAVKSAVAVAVALCQRNTLRLEPQESESLWFRLLDRIVEPLRDLIIANSDNLKSKKHSSRSRHHGEKIERRQTQGKRVRGVLVGLMGTIIDGMMGYVPLHAIMEKILADHGSHPFGDFRATILNMLSAYGYERAILRTAKQLIEDDTFYNINSLRKGFTHAFSALNSTCCICGLGLDDQDSYTNHISTEKRKEGAGAEGSRRNEVAPSGFRIFYCGHAAHIDCISGSGSLKGEVRGIGGCPICSAKQNSSSMSSHAKTAVWQGEVRESDLEQSTGQGTTSTYLRGTINKGNHNIVVDSRLEVLNQLQQGKGLSDLGPELQLRLAPPRKFRARSAPVPDTSNTSRSRPAHRTLAARR